MLRTANYIITDRDFFYFRISLLITQPNINFLRIFRPCERYTKHKYHFYFSFFFSSHLSFVLYLQLEEKYRRALHTKVQTSDTSKYSVYREECPCNLSTQGHTSGFSILQSKKFSDLHHHHPSLRYKIPPLKPI